MKTLLQYESKIQQILIAIFIITIITIIVFKKDLFSMVFIIQFFVLAIVQYTLNTIKFFNKNYVRTDSRKLYMFLSTFVVLGFLTWKLSFVFHWVALDQLSGIMALSWTILTPILIFQSLFISLSDSKNKKENKN